MSIWRRGRSPQTTSTPSARFRASDARGYSFSVGSPNRTVLFGTREVHDYESTKLEGYRCEPTAVLIARLAVLIILIALLAGHLIWFNTVGPNPAMGDYPGGGHLAADYEQYIGERVVVNGEVVDTNPVLVRYGPADDPKLFLTVTELSIQPERGDPISIFGIVRPDHTIEAINVVIHDRRGLSEYGLSHTWAVSFLAGIWVLGRILNHWRLNTHDLTLRPRAETWLETRREDDNA